jgi:hypothetical protein
MSRGGRAAEDRLGLMIVSLPHLVTAGWGGNQALKLEEPVAARLWGQETLRAQGYRVKRISACGGCLGDYRRRRTWQPAKSPGELANEL